MLNMFFLRIVKRVFVFKERQPDVLHRNGLQRRLWYEEYASQRRKPFEDGKWYECERRYYNPYSLLVNENYLNRFPKYKYSAYEKFNGKCVLEYLRIYEEYPETEYLLKAGISSYLVMKKSFLKKLKTDKNFRK